MWKKWLDNWKKKEQKWLGPGMNMIPSLILLVCASAAIFNYEPEAGEKRNLSVLFENYEDKMETALLEVVSAKQEDENKAGAAETFRDGVYTGTGTGFGGQIKVQVTVKDTKIIAIEILSASGEDASFLQKAKAVIDRIIAAQTVEVDTVSGATYSSRGIIAAVKNALFGTKDANSTANSTSSRKAEETPTAEIPENGYKDGVYKGSAEGFGGTITVEVTIKNGKISKISILDASGETPSYLKKAKQVLKTMIKKQTPNVEAVSGATFSSNGIIKAVQNALKKAAKDEKQDDTDSTTEKKENTKKEETKKEETESPKYKDGTYTGTGKGFRGDITVNVVIKKGKITSVSVTKAKDDEAFLKKAKALIEDMISKQNADVDTVTGATYSSEGIIEAVKNALAKAAYQTEEDEEKETSTEKNNQEKETTAAETTTVESSTSGQITTTEKEATEETATDTESVSKKYKDGIYTGKGEGFDGQIKAVITIKEGCIQAIRLSADSNEEWIDKVKTILISAALENQSGDQLDIVSGATFSSQGAIEAIQNALSKALNF